MATNVLCVTSRLRRPWVPFSCTGHVGFQKFRNLTAKLPPPSAKGFADADSKTKDDSVSSSPDSADMVDKSVEDLEERIKGRKKRSGKIEPKVKVVSPVVDAVTGKAEPSPIGAAETTAVQILGVLFVIVLVEGLLLAASGFLPDEWDEFVAVNLYPSYSYTVLSFLGGSTLYGLFKVGKLPFQEALVKAMMSKDKK